MVIMKNKTIYIMWEGPFTLDEVRNLNTNNDYGLYQIYGTHSVYGAGALLYIGKAITYSFGKSIHIAGWEYYDNANELQIYIGRIQGDSHLSATEETIQIYSCHKLMIYAHSPACNSEVKNNFDSDEDLKPLQIINCANYKALLPEVSGAKWASGLGMTIKNYKLRRLFLEDDTDFIACLHSDENKDIKSA